MTIEISTLANGLIIATDSMAQAHSTALGIWVRAGTRDEPAEAQGVAHLVEHMLFKGTPTRDAMALSTAIENVGGHFNAYTGREETAYYARVLPEYLPLASDVLADMVLRSLLDPQELERERGVIIQEIGRAYDTPEDYIMDCLQETAFPAQGLGWPILGQANAIATMPRARLTEWLALHYNGASMVLAAAGQVTHQALRALAERDWSGVPTGARKPRSPACYRSGQRHENRILEQHHHVMGFPTAGYHDKDYMASKALGIILGGGSSSRLFQEVREKRGLAYDVHAGTHTYDDTGLMLVYAGTSLEQADALQHILWHELERLPNDITADEVSRAQAQMRAGLLMGQESTRVRLEKMAGDLLTYGKPLSLETRLEQIAALTPEMIAELAARLTRDQATIVTLGGGSV